MAKTTPFDEHLNEYEQWFADHYPVFQSELEAIRQVLPSGDERVEIGVGSGIFAAPLEVKKGIEPSAVMREKAKERGVDAIDGIAEELPFPGESMDTALMVTTICFVDDVIQAFREVHRVLKPGGSFVIGFVDKNSSLGQLYLQKKAKSLFYQDATFYSTAEIMDYLKETGFLVESVRQTVFGRPDEINEVQLSLPGYGEGCFVVIKAGKRG